jgi:NAD(P)-dependent dehydrogenase (short-subunit alcohol dehydrogenase family)
MAASIFKEQVVVITGASSGIGREVAHQLAAQGARLVLAARRAGELENAAAECRALGGQALAVPTDISQQQQCQALIDKTIAVYGRLDMLVNDAGISMWSLFEEVPDLSLFEKIMQTNYLGYVYCTYYALPHLKQSRGRIVAVSSLAGKNGIPTRSGYSASKYAVTGFFDSLRSELLDTGVTVTVVFPGYVASKGPGSGLGTGGVVPIGQSPRGISVMTPEECARIILRAAAKRRREELIGWQGKLSVWVRLIFPGLVDRIARRAAGVG